jgi:sulfate permease, SulP family
MISFRQWVPMLDWLGSYRKEWVGLDIVAGLTAAAVVIPQAMAYGAIASLPLVVGLYTALVPLLVYAVLGTSRPLSVTTTSTIAILTAATLREAAPDGDTATLVTVAATLAFGVGGVLFLASLLRLGFVAHFISEPVLVGFKAGIGLVIVVDQIPRLLGVHIAKGHFFHNVTAILNHLSQASMATVTLAVVMLALQVVLIRYSPKVPAALAAVAVGIAASAFLGLEHQGIELVGKIAGGLPTFAPPKLPLLADLWPAAVGIGLMSFVETIAAGRAFAREDEPRLEANRELCALGLANLVGGCFHNLPSGGGTSQTAVNRQAGARTQAAALVTAALVVSVLLFLAPVVHLMPQATLAAVVVVPCVGMIHLGDFGAILRTRFMEFSWALTALAGVLVFGTLRGILVAVLLSLLALVYHANHRPVFVLGRKPGTDVFRPCSPAHPGDETFPGLLLLKTEGILHFGNAERIADLLRAAIEQHNPRVVVLDCSAIPDFEYTALKWLTEAERRMQQRGISLWLAALNPQPLQLIQNAPLGATLGRQRMHFNLETAVESFLKLGAAQEKSVASPEAPKEIKHES